MTRKEAITKAQEIQGWMSPEELGWLYDRAFEMDSVLEVGCWKGRSTFVIAAACKGRVYAVDHFRGSPSEQDCHREAFAKPGTIEKEFVRNILDQFSNVAMIPTSSEAAARGFKWRVDMIFIDGDHAYEPVKADILAWRPKARKLFCGHDRSQDGVPAALKDCGVIYRSGPGCIWYDDLRTTPYDIMSEAYDESSWTSGRQILYSSMKYLSDPEHHGAYRSRTGGSRVQNWVDSEAK